MTTKIAISKIANDDVRDAVFKALELINAKSLFSKPKMKVLIKPNIILPKTPDCAATTHPAVVKAVIQWLKQFDPEKIIVGESGNTFKRGITEQAFEKSGIKAICEEEKVEWIPFEKTPRKIYQVKNPLVLNEFPGSKLLEEVDLIVNIPKIKTHTQCLLTCSIKNMFGTVILGHKPKTHARFSRLEDFSAALADIHSVSRPRLTVIDGYYCQEGNGPNTGDVVKLDLILAGYDPVALDTVVCKIIDFNPKEVIHITKAELKGLGTTNLKECELLGEPIDSVKRKFKRPRSAPVSVPLPAFLARYVQRAVFRSSILFNPSKCKLCGTCWQNCPVQAISPPSELKQGITVPKWDKKKCITCYCCVELCQYEAVDFEVNILKNVLNSWLFVIFLGLFAGFAGLIWLVVSLLF